MSEEIGINGPIFLELGASLLGLAFLGRLAARLRISPIPFYLVAGLAFGTGGLLPLDFTSSFVHIGAEIGILLLLFMLGLEYTAEELKDNFVSQWKAGVLDIALNFIPGLLFGFLIGLGFVGSVLLGGITYISSSGVIAKFLSDSKGLGNAESRVVMSILVLEDLAMVLYLPIVAILLVGTSYLDTFVSLGGTLTLVSAVVFVLMRYRQKLSEILVHSSDEILLLTIVGVVLTVGGFAELFHVSAAISAFLVGVVFSGPIVSSIHRRVGPLRDFFAAIFFFFFGLQVDPAALWPVFWPALGLALITAITKIATGWIACRMNNLSHQSSVRAGFALVARGEFSMVIGGLGVAAGIDPKLAALAAAYVFILAAAGPILASRVYLLK